MELTTPLDEEPLRYQTINSILENRAEQIGDDIAIHYGPEDRSLSYRELNNISNSIANSLRAHGVASRDKVSVMMANPLESVLMMLGINKAGAVYVPVNYEYKGDILLYQLNDTSPELLAIEDQYVNRINDIKESLEVLPELVVSETADDGSAPHPEFSSVSFDSLLDGTPSVPAVDIEWDDFAGILYTSGTTGQPKGVPITHRWIFRNYVLNRVVVMNEDDVVHTSLPFYHVTAPYYDLMSALTVGGETAIWDQFSTSEFWDRVNKYEATTATLISVMIPWLANAPASPTDNRNTLNKVHLQPTPDRYHEIAERYAFDFVGTAYGSTESGGPIAAYIHAAKGGAGTPDDLYRGTTPSEVKEGAEMIGIPIVDERPSDDYTYVGEPVGGVMEVSLRDERDEEIETGVGELCFRPKISGIIFPRYFKKPEKTVEAFQNLWFHTGDAGYRDEEGNLYWVDRIGGVIRRRGENISSMQVEDIVGGHDAVSQVAAFPVPAEEGGEDEVAVGVQIADGKEISEEELRDYLKPRMPEFMRPRYIYFVEDMPTTGTNKVEKNELRDQLM